MKVTRTEMYISLRVRVCVSTTECVTGGTVAGSERKSGGLKVAQFFQSLRVPVITRSHRVGIQCVFAGCREDWRGVSGTVCAKCPALKQKPRVQDLALSPRVRN